jgi:hypothetical protein
MMNESRKQQLFGSPSNLERWRKTLGTVPAGHILHFPCSNEKSILRYEARGVSKTPKAPKADSSPP